MRPLKANVFGNSSHPSNQKKPMLHIHKKIWKKIKAKSCQIMKGKKILKNLESHQNIAQFLSFSTFVFSPLAKFG
jgi:hypothetical protein